MARIDFLNSSSLRGSATATFPSPRTATAFNLLRPMTAPRPPEPLESSSARRPAKTTPFSPAMPVATTPVDLPSSLLRISLTSAAPFPHKWDACRNSALPSSTRR